MRRLVAVVFGIGLGALAMFLAFNIHVVRTDSDWHFVNKQETEFADCFADVRKWDVEEWGKHPELKKALIEAGKGEIVKEPPPQELLFDVLDAWKNARRNPDTTRQ